MQAAAYVDIERLRRQGGNANIAAHHHVTSNKKSNAALGHNIDVARHVDVVEVVAPARQCDVDISVFAAQSIGEQRGLRIVVFFGERAYDVRPGILSRVAAAASIFLRNRTALGILLEAWHVHLRCGIHDPCSCRVPTLGRQIALQRRVARNVHRAYDLRRSQYPQVAAHGDVAVVG